MKIINTWLIKGLYILSIAIILYGCSKGKLDEDFVELNTMEFSSLESINPTSFDIDARHYLSGTIILPHTERDSLDVTINYDNDTKKIQRRIVNQRGRSKYYIYYANLVDSTIVVSEKHPLGEDLKEDGNMYFKFFGQNSILNPDGGPMHFAVYGFANDGGNGEPVTYTDLPIDTIFNINNDIPKDFIKIRRLFRTENVGLHIKLKFLKANKEESLVDGRRVYTFLVNNYPFINKSSRFLMHIPDGRVSTRIRMDANNGSRHLDNGITFNMNLYMER